MVTLGLVLTVGGCQSLPITFGQLYDVSFSDVVVNVDGDGELTAIEFRVDTEGEADNVEIDIRFDSTIDFSESSRTVKLDTRNFEEGFETVTLDVADIQAFVAASDNNDIVAGETYYVPVRLNARSGQETDEVDNQAFSTTGFVWP